MQKAAVSENRSKWFSNLLAIFTRTEGQHCQTLGSVHPPHRAANTHSDMYYALAQEHTCDSHTHTDTDITWSAVIEAQRRVRQLSGAASNERHSIFRCVCVRRCGSDELWAALTRCTPIKNRTLTTSPTPPESRWTAGHDLVSVLWFHTPLSYWRIYKQILFYTMSLH